MNRRALSWMIPILLLTVATSAVADRLEEASEKVPAGDYKAVDVVIDFGAGTLDIAAAKTDLPATLDVTYEPRYVDYKFDFDERLGTCLVRMESDIRKHNWDHGDFENEWIVGLSTKYPMTLDLDIGACDGTMDLGGLSLSEVTMDVGAADLSIDFSEPNPIRMREFNLDLGASSLTIDGLANANVDRMEFNVGAGSCDLDFRGEYRGETEVRIDVGVGSMDIVIPRDVAVMIRGDDGFFSSLNVRGLDVRKSRGGIWESENFDTAKDRIIFDVSVAMGSVDIRGR